ncbi:MAG: enoyl-CoA hydratase/isomerase family protein [Candidatus Eremiobacteraeota bacterium]|nr:enoyl-CoA hydratase/isomerase family protein [Candidatus Eremiobacteraeota bacterium]
MDLRLVSIDDRGPVRLLTIQRPEVRNAMSQALMGEIADVLSQSEDAGLRVLVITGAGEASFCSGGDLREFDGLRDRESTIAMSLRMQRLARGLRRSPLISIAALGGDAYGGGLEFALACDLRVAAEHVRLGFLQVTLGITPAWRGVSRLRELVGRSTALRLLLTGERFDARTALVLGLVDRVAERGRAVDAALELAGAIVAHPAAAVRIIKEMVDAPSSDDDTALAREAAMFAEAWLSKEHWAAVEAREALRRNRAE